MSDPNVYQQLGSLQAKVAALERGQQSANRKLDTLLERSAKDRGARGMLLRVAAGGGVVGGIAVGVLQWFADRGHTP